MPSHHYLLLSLHHLAPLQCLLPTHTHLTHLTRTISRTESALQVSHITLSAPLLPSPHHPHLSPPHHPSHTLLEHLHHFHRHSRLPFPEECHHHRLPLPPLTACPLALPYPRHTSLPYHHLPTTNNNFLSLLHIITNTHLSLRHRMLLPRLLDSYLPRLPLHQST